MWPKNKLKSDTTSPRISVDTTSSIDTHNASRPAQKSGAFSYIKSRLFHASGATPSAGQRHNVDSEDIPHTSLATSASIEAVILPGVRDSSPGNLDIPKPNSRNRPECETILSKSLEPPANQEWASTFSSAVNARPVSVLGLEGVMKQIAPTNGNPVNQSELEELHARQLSALTTPVKRPNTISKIHQSKSKRLSAIVIKEGYLFKKTDIKTFSRTARLDRSWKGYHVVLRGHKLYLYRAQNESALKSYFPSPKDNMSISQSSNSFGSQSLSSEVFPSSFPLLDKGMAWDYHDFDPDSLTVLSSVCRLSGDSTPTSHNSEYLYGDCFTEIDKITGAYKGYFCLLIFKSRLLICKKDWSKTKGISKNGDILLNRSDAGHSATKWKVDVDLSLNSVALSPRLSEVDKKSSEEGRPGVMEPLETVEQGYRLPLVTKKSDTSLSSQVVELDISPPGHAFRPSRQFVPSSTDAGKSWTEHFSKAVKRTASHSSALQTATSGTASDSSSLILKDSQVPTEYFDYRDIQGGTVIELFHELLRLRKDYSEAGYMEFVRAFLLTYPLFTTSAELISAVKTELKASATDPESGAWAKKRVYQITHIWCEDFKADVVGEVATGLLDILDMELWNSESDLTPYITPEMVADLKKMVLSAVDENAINYETSISLETESLSYDVNANTVIKGSNYLPSKTPGHTIDVTGLLKDGLTPSLFLHMDPYEFAKQLYLFHKSSYQTYRTRLLNPLCYIPQSLPSTTTPMHLLFTTSSPHFLTSFVNQHILIDSHQIGTDRPHELVTRAMLIEHWIRVGEELLEIGDMCGWCAIAVSICSFAILRLKQSWKFVNQDLVERVRNLWTPVLIKSNMFSTDIWIDDWQYYSTRAKLNVLDASLTGITLKDPHAHHFRYPTSNGIPFFGVIRQYVERLRRHVNRYLSSPINTHEQSPPIVNFEKHWSIYDAVWCSLERYQMLQTQDDDHENNLKIEPIGPIQAFFEHTHVNLSSVPNDFNVLQECSLECEPKPLLLGGSIGYQQNWAAFSDSVAPPPSWILSFPQLVSTIKLSDTLTGTFHPSSVRNMKIFQQLPAPRTSRSKKINMPDTIQEMDATVKGDGGHATSTSSIQETGRLARYRKRTYSFPSSRSNSELGIEGGFSAAENMENNSRSWVNPENYRKASVVSKSPFHAISHIGAVGEKLLSVRDGELILQIDIANERKLSCTSFDSLFGYTLQPVALEPINPISKTSVTWTEEQHQVSATDRTIESQNVIVKAGTFERLIDVLIYGLSEYSANVDRQDEFGEYVFSECRLSVDMQEYVHTFFVTYRTFLSATELLEQLRKSFINACSIGRITKLRQKYSLKSMFEPTFDSKNSMDEPDISDWKYIARVRLQILDLIIFWIDEFFWDFVNDSGNRKRTSQFIQQTTKSIEEMRLHVGELMEENGDIDEEAERVTKLLDIIHQKMKYIHDRLLFQFLSPTLEHRAIADLQTSQLDKVDIIEKCSNLTSQAKVEPKTGPNGSVQSPYVSAKPTSPVSSQQLFPKRHLQSVMDQLGPADILQQVDSIVQQVFKDITLQDWILLYDALAAQSVDPYSWLPVRKGLNYSSSNQWMPHPYTDQTAVSNVIDDEVVVSDIFIAIQSARRSTGFSTAGTGDNLLSALPEAIQQLFSLHFSVRSWVINELTSFTIDAEHRAERIQKCLDMVVLSRLRMASEPAFKEFINNPDVLDPLSNGGKVIPGFVEYSILSALVSPQVRLFSKAWSKTAEKNQAQNLDTLESIVDSAVTIAQLSQPLSKVTRSRPYVIGLGWILEMMLQLCEDSTESLRNNEPLVKFDQYRYVYNFLRFITGIQELIRQESGIRMSESGNFTEKLRESLAPRLMDFLTAPTTTWPPMPWKELRDFTNRENVGQDKLKTSSTTSALTQKLSSNASHGAHAIPGLGSKTTVFGKLVSRQQEKLKADIKERDRIDREWRDVQHKMQKKQLEQAKHIEKREKKLLKHQHGSSHQSSHLPWINSFLRGLKLTHTIGDSQESLTGGKDSILQNEILAPPTITDNMKASNVINLINSTSSVASTYLKRDFVFRIVTEEGGQFLFQAINDSEMHDWIRTINNAAKEGAARRLTVLVAEAEIKRRSGTSDDLVFLDDRQRKKGKSVRGSVYGVELSELMGNGKIPLIVEKCIDEIERRGLEEVGIYRVAGSGETVAELRQQLNRNVASVNLSDDAWIDINVVADALKQFFRDLPEPLLTFDRYADFMKASALVDHDERILAIKQTTKQLATNNYILLKRLIEHFVVVTDYEASNHMYATNLAIVFGPTLLRPEPGPVSFATTMANIGHQQNIVKNLITHYHFIFDVESEDCDREPEQEEDNSSDEQEPERVNNSE